MNALRLPSLLRSIAGLVLASVLLAEAVTAVRADPTATPEILQSIVRIESTVPVEARTARTLGTQRSGSGVIIDGEGLIVTVGYLVMEADSIEVENAEGGRFPAELVAYDHDTGFGLIRTAVPPGGRALELGDSTALSLRQPVLVASHGGTGRVMGAFVVDRRDFAGYWEYLLENAIFTSPPHPEFGGAALLDSTGRLVGIGSLIVPDALTEENRIYPGNMFIPINALKPIMADLIARGRSARNDRPWLGITSEEFRGRVFVRRVAEGGPARAAGVQPGDLLLGVAGAPVAGLADFYRRVWALGDAGVEVPLMVLRGNEPLELTVRSIDRYRWLRLRPTY